jgi:hypothetical protein
MDNKFEYSYGYVASVNSDKVDSLVVPDGRTAPVWYDTVEKAEEAMNNDLRFSTETFIVARPKVSWFRWEKAS